MNDPESEPYLLQAELLMPTDHGLMVWDTADNEDWLSITNSSATVEWIQKKQPDSANHLLPVWIPATTKAHLHSGWFTWDFFIEEMAGGQIGIGYMLLWDIGPDWGFYGYLGASSTAWAYDPSTGDVVTNTASIQGNLPTFADGHQGVVSVELNLPRDSEGSGVFIVNGVRSQPITLPSGAVVMPAACLLKESQKITIKNYQRRQRFA